MLKQVIAGVLLANAVVTVAFAGDGPFFREQRRQEQLMQQQKPAETAAQRKAEDDYAGKVIAANPENYRSN